MITFVEVDPKKTLDEMINDFEKALNDTLYPGDERRIFLEQLTQVIVGLKNNINDTGKQNLLRYARGEKLKAIGERSDTGKIPAKKAKTIFRFPLSAAQGINITIPKGTRGTPDGTLFFATVEDTIIPAGELSGDVKAEATEGGSIYNGFAPGQIKTLVDLIPFVSGVTNITTSADGSDEESDEHYRERIREAPSKFSTAGPEGAYIYWAKTDRPDIADVAVISPAPCQIQIIVLMNDGQPPSQTVLDTVLEACSGKKRRPLSDKVTALGPSEIQTSINLTYYISTSRREEESAIRTAIESTGGAIDQYKKWQRSTLGKAINPDYLKGLCLNAGACKVDIVTPEFTQLEVNEVAAITSTTINYGGLING